MKHLKIKVREGIYLSSIQPTDKSALLEYLHTKDVYRTTLNIPHPYLEADADSWIQKRIEHTKRIGNEITFAIRNAEDKLIGGIGAKPSSRPVRTGRRSATGWPSRFGDRES